MLKGFSMNNFDIALYARAALILQRFLANNCALFYLVILKNDCF